VGYYAKHNAQQKVVIENAFGPIKDATPQSPN
jgi:2-oxoglutarate dehydrogenase E1 component